MLGLLSVLGRSVPGSPGASPHCLEACIVLHGLMLPVLRGPARGMMVRVVVMAPIPAPKPASAFTCRLGALQNAVHCMALTPALINPNMHAMDLTSAEAHLSLKSSWDCAYSNVLQSSGPQR